MILRFGVKNKLIEYRQIDIKFPTERDKHSIDILSRSHHVKSWSISNHFHIQEFRHLHLLECRDAYRRNLRPYMERLDIENGIIHVQKTIQRIYIVEEDRKHTESFLTLPKPKTRFAKFR